MQYNDGGAFGGMGNVTFNDTTGALKLGNLGITTSQIANGVYQNWITAPAKLGNTATASAYMPGRYLLGGGLGGTPGSGGAGDFSTAVDVSNNGRNSRVWIADRWTATDTGLRTTAFYSTQWIDVSGNITNSNTRLQGIGSEMFVGGGNLTVNNPAVYRNLNLAFTAGTNGNANVGNTTIACGTSINSYMEARAGSRFDNAVHLFVNTAVAGNIGNIYGMTSAVNSLGIDKYVQIHMQSGASPNPWGMFGFASVPSQYYFLENTDTRSKSKVGPIESYYDRPYTFTTTSGTVDLDWNNGTSQYLKPSGDVTLNFTNALTSSNGDLFHTVTLVVEQGATPYNITLPVGNATIKYAAGISSVSASANSVVMITVTAANINSNTTYLATISPEFQ